MTDHLVKYYSGAMNFCCTFKFSLYLPYVYISAWSLQQNHFHSETLAFYTLPFSTCASSGSIRQASQFIR